MWWLGIPAERIQPLKKLRGYDVPVENDGVYLSKGKFVMNWLAKAVVDQNLLPAGVRSIDDLKLARELIIIFNLVFQYLCSLLYPNLSREDIDDKGFIRESYLTYYRDLKRHLGA